ncbi:MAG: amidohydrolase [Bacilli bacterium]|nr:amidohydrolase [Bacilli bacterium]
MRILFKNARILTLASDDIFSGELLVKDNLIEYVGPKANPSLKADKVIDCMGNLLMPGFKNAHAHTAMVFARSASDDLPLHEWLFDCIFPMEEKFIDGDIYHLTKCGILEYLSGGITAAFDMYFNPPEIVKACEEIGFRNVILATSLSEPISLLRERFQKWNKKDSLISYQLGLHAEYTTPKERIQEIADLANELKAPVYLHVGETEQEVQGCVDRYGMRPIKFLDSLGLFNYGGGGFHCNYFDDEEIEICKKRHINIVTCPGSNLKLASGIAPLVRYKKEGLNIAIGTDGPASNNSLDMFKEMYLVSCLQKVVNKDASCMDGCEVLKMATVNSAHAMGLNNADVLAKDKYADIIMIDLKNPAMQPINNIKKNIVYAGSKDIVKMTMINGKILYMDHKFYIDEDVEEIYRKAQEITERLKK